MTFFLKVCNGKLYALGVRDQGDRLGSLPETSVTLSKSFNLSGLPSLIHNM